MGGPYTRYVMRSSGQGPFQPAGADELEAFAALDYLRRKGGDGILARVLDGTEAEKDMIVQALVEDIRRACGPSRPPRLS